MYHLLLYTIIIDCSFWYDTTRLPILECRGIWLMRISMCLVVAWSLFAGLPLRPSYTSDTLLPVMCGAMDVSSTRYGVLDTSLLKALKLERFVICATPTATHTGFNSLKLYVFADTQILQLVSKGYRLPPPSGCPKTIYNLMIDTW